MIYYFSNEIADCCSNRLATLPQKDRKNLLTFGQGPIVSAHVFNSWNNTSKSVAKIAVALRCAVSADQNMAAYNRPLDFYIQ